MPRTVTSVGLCAALLLAASALPSVALARPRMLQDGASPGFAIGTGGNVLVLNHFPDQGFDFWFGVRTSDDTGFGFFQLFLTPDLALAVTLGNIVVGARFEAGFYHNNPDGPFGADTNIGFFGIVPFFEYWFDGDSMAPFIGLSFGPTITAPDGADAQVWLEGAATGGLGFFVSEGFSLAPTLSISFMYNSANERAGWGATIGFEMRGWIGLDGGGGSSGGGSGGGDRPAPAPAPTIVDPEGGMQ